MATTVRKVKAAVDRTGFYGPHAVGLGGVTPAVWGVFKDDVLLAHVQRHRRGTWEVFDAQAFPFRRLSPRGWRSAAEAKAWAIANL